MVPMARIGLATSPLPRECSTTEPHGQKPKQTGAGEGNRTLVVSLEGFCSTIELHPRTPASNFMGPAAGTACANRTPAIASKFTEQINMVEGEGFEPSKAEPSDLQSDPFDRSGTPPNETCNYVGFLIPCQSLPGGSGTRPRRTGMLPGFPAACPDPCGPRQPWL